MESPLSKNAFLVREHVGLFKAANNFDIFDPETGQIVLECREEKLGFLTKLLRFSDYKRYTPFHIEIRAPQGHSIIHIIRGVSLFLSKVDVRDEDQALLGRFKQKFFSIGGKFDVLSPDDQVLCQLTGQWTAWNFSFGYQGIEFARVSKEWSGIGKEFFTSADNYILSIDSSVETDSPLRSLIMAAVMCIDMVLKE